MALAETTGGIVQTRHKGACMHAQYCLLPPRSGQIGQLPGSPSMCCQQTLLMLIVILAEKSSARILHTST